MAHKGRITAVIVDDEPLARHGLRDILSAEKDIVVVAEAADGDEAVAMIARHSPQVVFLDIQMPESNGFDVVRALPAKKMPLIVFVTAYDEFAVKAFEANALDYVLKPFDAERIHSTLHRVHEMVRLKTSAEYSHKITEAMESIRTAKKYLQRIVIRAAGKISFIAVDDILWIEAAADYIHLHTKNGSQITREMIGTIEQQLDPSRFVRIHRSAIVNIHAVRELLPMEHGEFTAILTEGTRLTVSRTYKERINDLIG